jgi:hypothetical protein
LTCAQDLLLVGGDQNVVDVLVEFLDDVQPTGKGKFGIENAASDAELLEEELDSVGSFDIGDEDNCFTLDQLQKEQSV